VVSLVFLSFASCILISVRMFDDYFFRAGHDRITTYSDIAIAVARGFEGPRSIL
jgi:hypothetical protein